MTAVHLTKHVALGNDFLIGVEPPRELTPRDAVAWCDRRRGVGADGLITLTADPAAKGRWAMVLLNSDGSRAEVSGNGLRGVAQALARHTRADAPCQFEVTTDGGLRTLDVLSLDGVEALVRADMGAVRPGPPTFDDWEGLGVEIDRQIGLDIGNPHLVVVVDDPTRHDLAVIGPAVESRYPQGLNVHLIKVTSDRSLDLRVWERGAGITEACGSGACAAAAATSEWGLTGPVVEVTMPGGTATVERTESDSLLLTGPATFIADITITESPTPEEV